MNPKVLLLSAYDAASHRHWRQSLATMFPQYQWTQLRLPPRNFNWRIRGNSLLWAFNANEQLQQEFDLLIATSMVDLASLRGLVPALTRIPSLVYFHENQFVYPSNQQLSQTAAGLSQTNVEPKLVPLYSALCADEILFNSHYNRRSFLDGCQDLINKLPDKIPPAVLAKLHKSKVIPVPLSQTNPNSDTKNTETSTICATSETGTLNVIWNHRWEFDKGPETLLEIIKQTVQQKLPLRFHIVGEKFRQTPSEFTTIEDLLAHHCQITGTSPGQFGYVKNRQDYYRLLQSCDVALSTAQHDFQGLALQEAIAAGCTPLAPDRLVYPEYLEEKFLYDATDDRPEWSMAIDKLAAWQRDKSSGKLLPKTHVSRYSEDVLKKDYAALFERLLSKF